MNRNQKIAIGCGGAGCLGLLVVAIVGVVLYFYWPARTTNRNTNISISSNRASNTNSSDSDSSNANSSNSSDTPSSSMSDDDKHRLFQAGSSTQDSELILRVHRKIGFNVASGSDYENFVIDHVTWALTNAEFIVSVSTPEKARAYVEAHLDD